MSVKFVGKTIHRLGVFIAGLWMGGLAINIIWPTYNNMERSNLESKSDLNSIEINK
tara:strand:- start:355 stop:522 length:168 start_codon:yes stop_codon:yes gene_type:complete